VELRELAETILFANAIEGKLAAAEDWSDAQRRSQIETPLLPGRPKNLALDSGRPKHPFPGLTRDGPLRARGEVLHYFANHELLAIELMALFLLRFPDAPPGLRRAVAGTIGEEQDHLRAYMARMADFGVSFGDVPVNRFFWDCLAQMRGPLDYLAGMSLTLEQANLDFCAHYIARFASIDDPQTARLLQQVHDDEIGHVGLGVLWFERLREPGDTRELWARYRAALCHPLTPARAVGIGFNFSGREAAGLSAEFTEALAAYGHSKGRPPVLHYFNPLAEFYLAASAPSPTVPRALAQLTADLETLPMFLAGKDDAVLVNRTPRATFLAGLRHQGITIPEFITPEPCAPPEADSPSDPRRLSRLQPWALSPDAEVALAPFVARQPSLALPVVDPRCFKKTWSVELAREWAAENSQDWITPESLLGTALPNSDEAMELAEELLRRGNRVVVKAPLGTSGRGMVRIFTAADHASARAWTERTVASQGAVVVEPWLDRLLDLSVQINVAEDGSVRVLGVTRFTTDSRGQYLGTLLGDPLRAIDTPMRRALVGPGRGWRMFEHLEEVGLFVGKHLAGLGHRGPAGIDALVYRDAVGGIRLKPIVEVNPRCTMGHIALALSRQLGKKRRGHFLLLGPADARRAAVSTLAELVEQLPQGSLCLTDPDRATALVAVLVPE